MASDGDQAGLRTARTGARVTLLIFLIVVAAVPAEVSAQEAQPDPTACDASGNGLALTIQGDPVPSTSPREKFGSGLALDGDDWLEVFESSLDPTGPTAVFVAFKLDRLPVPEERSWRIVSVNSASGGAYLFVKITPNGTLVYHNSGSGDQPLDQRIEPGFHVLWLHRTDGGVTVQLDQGPERKVLYEMARWLPKQDNVLTLGGKANHAERAIDGGLYEARYWQASIPSTATLETISDPGARGSEGFEATLEGNETGAWFLEGSEGGQRQSGSGDCPTGDPDEVRVGSEGMVPGVLALAGTALAAGRDR